MEDLSETLIEAVNSHDPVSKINASNKFCILINTNESAEVCEAICKSLTHKLQSPLRSEADSALNLLEKCVGGEYRPVSKFLKSEIGKFRFLNELIKLLSPKYYGNQTPQPFKVRLSKLLQKWTVELYDEQKIKDAFDMLNSQGLIVLKELGDGSYHQVDSQQDSVLSEDRGALNDFMSEEKTEKLKKLLQSTKKEDVAAANKLIRSIVDAEYLKANEHEKRCTELNTIQNNARLLIEMLDRLDADGTGKILTTSDSEHELIQELFDVCCRHRDQLIRMASACFQSTSQKSGDASQSSEITEILNINETVNLAVGRHRVFVEELTKWRRIEEERKRMESEEQRKRDLEVLHSDILLLELEDNETSSSTLNSPSNSGPTVVSRQSNIDDLLTMSNSHDSSRGGEGESLTLGLVKPLKSVVSSDAHTEGGVEDSPRRRQRVMDELDAIGRDAVINELGNRRVQKTVSNQSMSMKDMQRSKLLSETLAMNKTDTIDLGEFDTFAPQSSNFKSNGYVDASSQLRSNTPSKELHELQQTVSIQDVVPNAKIPPLVISGREKSEGGLHVVLNVGCLSAHPNFIPVVVTIINKSDAFIKDVKFEAVSPTCTPVLVVDGRSGESNLNPYNPFIPPSALTRIVLFELQLSDEKQPKDVLSPTKGCGDDEKVSVVLDYIVSWLDGGQSTSGGEDDNHRKERKKLTGHITQLPLK